MVSFFSKKVSQSEACKYIELVVSRNLQRKKCPKPGCPLSSFFWLHVTIVTTHPPSSTSIYPKENTKYWYMLLYIWTASGVQEQIVPRINSVFSGIPLYPFFYWVKHIKQPCFARPLVVPTVLKHEQDIQSALHIRRCHIHWFNQLWIEKIREKNSRKFQNQNLNLPIWQLFT